MGKSLVKPSPTSNNAKVVTVAEPKELVDGLEQGAELPSGNEELFAAYGITGGAVHLRRSLGHVSIPSFFARTRLHVGGVERWLVDLLGVLREVFSYVVRQIG